MRTQLFTAFWVERNDVTGRHAGRKKWGNFSPPLDDISPRSQITLVSTGLPLFSGESDDGPAEDFIQEVNRVLAAYEMADPLAIEYIIRHLRGKARREVLLRDRDDTNTPEKVTNILQEVFGDGRRVTTLLSIFYSRQLQPEESALNYSHVLRGLERTLHMKDAGSLTADFLRDRFVEGLFNPALRTHLRRMT